MSQPTLPEGVEVGEVERASNYSRWDHKPDELRLVKCFPAL